MSGEGMIASARPIDDPAPAGNLFYENAARRLSLRLPEVALAPGILAIVDHVLHEERVATRAGYGRKDSCDGMRRQADAEARS